MARMSNLFLGLFFLTGCSEFFPNAQELLVTSEEAYERHEDERALELASKALEDPKSTSPALLLLHYAVAPAALPDGRADFHAAEGMFAKLKAPGDPLGGSRARLLAFYEYVLGSLEGNPELRSRGLSGLCTIRSDERKCIEEVSAETREELLFARSRLVGEKYMLVLKAKETDWPLAGSEFEQLYALGFVDFRAAASLRARMARGADLKMTNAAYCRMLTETLLGERRILIPDDMLANSEFEAIQCTKTPQEMTLPP